MANAHNNARASGRYTQCLIFGGGSASAWDYFGPVFQGSYINLSSFAAASIVTACGFTIAQDGLWGLSKHYDALAGNTPTGHKGTADFLTEVEDLNHEIAPDHDAPYWGAMNREAITSNFASNALIVGTAGSGKTVGIVQPTILTTPGSKLITDFKSENTAVLKRALEDNGEEVRLLNFGDINTDIVGASDYYNPLNLMADNFWRDGSLRDVSDDTHEIAMQLYPEPDGDGGDNKFFRDGSRDLIGFAIQVSITIDGFEATLGDVAALLNDRQKLLNHALWVIGKLPATPDENGEPQFAKMPIEDSPWVSIHNQEDVSDYIAYFTEIAEKAAQLLGSVDSKTTESFLSGAQQALERYNRATRAFKKTKRSTFRFADMKRDPANGHKPLSVFVIADPSRMKAQKNVVSLIQWCALQEFKRHENYHVPVHVIADEATNFKIDGLADLMTWGRGFGIRLKLIIQDLAAFRRAYGKDALETLLSETEIKLFLPGQRNPETLSVIEKMLGKQAVMMQSQSGKPEASEYWNSGWNISEDAKPLLSTDQIREMDQGILFIRRNKPALVDVPPIAAIDPLRDQIDINPFHGKPFLLPVTVWLNGRSRFALDKVWRKIKRLFRLNIRDGVQKRNRYERIAKRLRSLSALIGFWWIAALIYLFAYTDIPYRIWHIINGGL
ncbi:type IV secretory system conjugative DNA transfer family protein [Lentilitoribacter sp. EG35]|uniref:type IV secretory system conjugative DNA transfer family protein n=1 Tax=Lentilitoribacter sp. EG35 TaxID=3234192 RepID=UPI0034611D08